MSVVNNISEYRVAMLVYSTYEEVCSDEGVSPSMKTKLDEYMANPAIDTFVSSPGDVTDIEIDHPFVVPFVPQSGVSANKYHTRTITRMIVAANNHAVNNGLRYNRFIVVYLPDLAKQMVTKLPDVVANHSQYTTLMSIQDENPFTGINPEYHNRMIIHPAVFALCPSHASWFVQTCGVVFGDNGGGAVDVSRLFAMAVLMAPGNNRYTFLSVIKHAFPGEMTC